MNTYTGGCLCKAVSYTVRGETQNFFHCHCSRCRKATGTGHASNVILSAATLEWESGADLVRHYKVPDAKAFENVFCSACGGRLPRFAKETGYVVLPAGSVDDDLNLKVDARIFNGSAQAWSCHDDELPAFDRYPTRS